MITSCINVCFDTDFAHHRENVEEGGCFEGADADCVSSRAKQRGRTQCGSLGSGNHYAEVQVQQRLDARLDGATKV